MLSTLRIKGPDIALTLDNTFGLSRLGLMVLSKNRPTLAQYEKCYQKLCLMMDCDQFWIGDLFIAAERDYGEDAYQIFDEFDFNRRTVGNFARVASAIPIERRRPQLKYGHHDCVAALPQAEQDQLLDEAVREELTVQQLRRRVREVRGEAPLPPLGQTLMQLAESWRAAPGKTAPECAKDLEEVINRYGLK